MCLCHNRKSSVICRKLESVHSTQTTSTRTDADIGWRHTHKHTHSHQPPLNRRALHRRGFLGGEWAAGSERQPWFTGQACSFTREISRATINTTVSFKGAVYHTTGFEGPQTDLVFVVFFVVPLLFPRLYSRMSLNTIKCEFPLLHFKWLLIDWPDFKTRPPPPPSATKSWPFTSRVRLVYH